MNHQDLERWSAAAVQELQELADELEESGSDPSAVRALIDEYDTICLGASNQASPTLDELAKAQNVKPMDDVRALSGTWPGDDVLVDEYEAIVDTEECAQRLIDTLRGELDRKNGQEPGWSGPITEGYLQGYGTHPRAAEHAEASAYREGHLDHGWY